MSMSKHFLKQVWYFISKNQSGLGRSGSTQASQTLLVSNLAAQWVFSCSLLAFHSWSASRRRIYIASASRYPSRTRNCGRLLITATQSSRRNCWSQLK